MLLLTATTDKLQVISGQAAALDVHASYTDLLTGAVTPGRQNTAITTAATTDVVASPAASTQRNVNTLNIRNKHATAACDVTVQYNQNGTLYELHKTTLSPGEALEYVEGVGFFEIAAVPAAPTPTYITSDQSIGVSTTAYLVGSAIAIAPARPVLLGTIFKWTIDIAKTAAGTVAASFDVRFGTAGTTGDTSRLTFSTGTQTAAADVAKITILATVRGPIGASCVVQSLFALTKGAASAAGFAVVPSIVLDPVSAAFDITTSGMIVGVSCTTGALHAYTVKQVVAEVLNI